jgi:class 3 adenylate cyclase
MAMREELEARSQELHEANARLAAQQERLEEQKLDLGEANLKLVEQNEIIEAERQHSEKLLLNILPQRVAAELKQRGATTPESFEDVTVFFSDVVDFTRLASELAPAVLIAELNDIFTHFDWIAKAHGCERIKTIGDAYLCVCGMPDPNPDNAMCVLEAAQEILAYLSERNRSSSHTWQIRIGIHSGSVVGGVVGVEKYIYDVFGDTINTAARMESWSSPMQINVSAATYERVKDRFRFIPRNPVEVKGKGLMSMYFLDPAGHLS